MILHPITVVEQVLDEYRSYLSTEFQARDEKLRQALEEALDQPRFLAQDPFFQAHRPFKSGKQWDELGLDAALAKVMIKRSESDKAYLHQSDAIEHLLSAQAGPLVVTTGTGSGKTECFLLPVIQNAIEDSTRFKRNGLTAVLVYPMNALANDQEDRIREYLSESGHTHVKVARYDRSTKEEERKQLREKPPHILLTNYMMLEYLMVRPSDRDALFANHRCRFVVLDEVHTYRGSLGANIALLFRRLLVHLKHAQQDWNTDDKADKNRFPEPLAIATSATIKSVDETDKSQAEVRRLRDQAVQEFLAALTGIEAKQFKVLGEEIQDLVVPAEARWPDKPVDVKVESLDEDNVRTTVAKLAGLDGEADVAKAARTAAILWKLNDLLARRPMSLAGIVNRILNDIPERKEASLDAVRAEVEAALIAGAALPDGTPGALRLRTHRFIRGGWQFTRCIKPECGRLFPMGEEKCSECGAVTAPLYICRSCGADTLRFAESEEGPEKAALRPNADRSELNEWMLYDRDRFNADDEDEDLVGLDKQMKERQILTGSFDPNTCSFSSNEKLYPMKVALAPGRNRCLVCGTMVGPGSVLTPVALGTSAAVRVISEGLLEGLAKQNKGKEGHDGKERLLIFSDSRQDAAHQARFITYAGRYDRMRRRLVQALERSDNGCLTIEAAVTELLAVGAKRRDNPECKRYDDAEFLPAGVQARARAWEEAPLLDDLAVSAGYRATVFNLGLVGVRYDKLVKYIEEKGAPLCSALGLSTAQLSHLCRCLLDEVRRNGCLSRKMLAYYPDNPNCPDEFKKPADWDRRVKRVKGLASDKEGNPELYLDVSEMPEGIQRINAWRAPKGRGAGPLLERLFKRMLTRMGAVEPAGELMREVINLLCSGSEWLTPVKLYGFRDTRVLLQVNADTVLLQKLSPEDRMRCSICNVRLPWSEPGAPCPKCHGKMELWSQADFEANRYVQRILATDLLPMVAGEHTAQITSDARIELEDDFKAKPEKSPINVLACSPTLEMGIDVGGLDAVVMRNVPPRPDNYAQRGGRAGRRSRVGIVLGYARSTPHDGYFFDQPEEMIAGEVPAPGIGLGNRDVVMRHLHAIALGAADPGLSGRMAEYINIKGELDQEKVDELIAALEARFAYAIDTADEAWGKDVLESAGFANKEELRIELDRLPEKIRDLFDRVRRQIIQLQETIDRWNDLGRGDLSAVHAMDLKRRLLGIRDDKHGSDRDADDRSSGHPMRRFAEFGILPGYEFPSEPATLRLWSDANEDDPIAVGRRFGIAQYQPDAPVHARGHRWRVVGLDLASPWNPKSPEPNWIYVRCKQCDLRYSAQAQVRCPRCGSDEIAGNEMPGHEYGGFLARRDDTPVLQEEDRFAIASLVRCNPQWDGSVIANYRLPTDWFAQLRREESVRWVNEWKPPSAADVKAGRPYLNEDGRGFYLCPRCGRVLTFEDKPEKKRKGREKAKKNNKGDSRGHAPSCEARGEPPKPCAITTETKATTLRIVVNLPLEMDDSNYHRWGYTLGYALRTGIRQLYMLDGPEIEFELENSWKEKSEDKHFRKGALTFIDPAVGGSGFLERAAREFNLVAKRAIAHLDHEHCETACYRCLKSYSNQRHHAHLSWPQIMPELEALASAAPKSVPLELGDRHEPKPWLEAFDAGVGSPLELKFLRLFEQHGLAVDKQVHVSINEGEKPISIADFVVTGTKVAIYIDGASFHRGERLRRDRMIRETLQKGDIGWKVVVFRATDLSKGNEVIETIREKMV